MISWSPPAAVLPVRRRRGHLADLAGPEPGTVPGSGASPARTSPSTRPAARSTRASTCPATTRMSRRYRFTYDSLTADPRPIVEIPHALSSTLATPSQVSGQITVATTGGTTVYTGSTWYYNTSQFMPGDIQQIAPPGEHDRAGTGRYNYTATVVDYRSTNTTTTITGTETVLNESIKRHRRWLEPGGAGADHLGVRRRDPRPGQRRADVSGSPAASAAAAAPTPTRPANSRRWSRTQVGDTRTP